MTLTLLATVALVWAFLTLIFWRRRFWLAFYMTGAFGFVLLAVSLAQLMGWDALVEAVEAGHVVRVCGALHIPMRGMGSAGLAIPTVDGWSLFNIGIECSALLETSVFFGLVGFYPGFTGRRKSVVMSIGLAATYLMNLARIVLIVVIVSWYGVGSAFIAHAVVGRVFFLTAVVVLYYYLITRPTVGLVGSRINHDREAAST
jgi:exosortase family protein XrtG